MTPGDPGTRALERLGTLSRLPLAVLPTPLLPADNLRREIAPEGPGLFLKMDAWTGAGLGGNKVRKLEHVLAPDRTAGVDTVVTSGSAQSNHARVTAAVAARLGLRCVLVLSGDPGDPPRGNALLHRLLGAEIRTVTTPEDRESEVATAAREVRDGGGTPLVVAIGASTPTGALGYVRAAVELDGQLERDGSRSDGPTWIVVPTSSCGTVAGLALGFALLGRDAADVRLLAVSADVPASEIRSTAARLVREGRELLGWQGELPPGMLVPTDRFVGRGYGLPTEASHEAVHLLAELEGVVLDPTYTSKAAAGLLHGLRSGRFDDASAVVFLHTGGHPALLA